MGNLISRICCKSLVNKTCIVVQRLQMSVKIIYNLHFFQLQMRLPSLLQTAMQRSTMPTPNKSCLSKNLYTTGRNTSRMDTHHPKDASILKTGTCQGITVILIQRIFTPSCEQCLTVVCTVNFSTGTFQSIMFTPHQCSLLLTGSMNTGTRSKWMITGLSTWDPKGRGTKNKESVIKLAKLSPYKTFSDPI